MADDSAVAVRALRRQRLNCTLETVKDVVAAIYFNAETFIVIISANFNLGHKLLCLKLLDWALDEKPTIRVCHCSKRTIEVLKGDKLWIQSEAKNQI